MQKYLLSSVEQPVYGPQRKKLHFCAALRAGRELLAFQKSNFMWQAVLHVVNAIDSAGRNDLAGRKVLGHEQVARHTFWAVRCDANVLTLPVAVCTGNCLAGNCQIGDRSKGIYRKTCSDASSLRDFRKLLLSGLNHRKRAKMKMFRQQDKYCWSDNPPRS